MHTILKKAATNRHTTLSYPALGTGIQLQYPEEKSAQWMVESIFDYCNLFPRCSLDTINIVLYDRASKQVGSSFVKYFVNNSNLDKSITKVAIVAY